MGSAELHLAVHIAQGGDGPLKATLDSEPSPSPASRSKFSLPLGKLPGPYTAIVSLNRNAWFAIRIRRESNSCFISLFKKQPPHLLVSHHPCNLSESEER